MLHLKTPQPNFPPSVPAKLIRYRFAPAIAHALEATAWWDWDHATLTERLPEFKNLRGFLAKYGPQTET